MDNTLLGLGLLALLLLINIIISSIILSKLTKSKNNNFTKSSYNKPAKPDSVSNSSYDSGSFIEQPVNFNTEYQEDLKRAALNPPK
jgi:hypothetical protein